MKAVVCKDDTSCMYKKEVLTTEDLMEVVCGAPEPKCVWSDEMVTIKDTE